MPTHLILRLEGPLQAWGDVAMDPRRPTRAFPSRSALGGLLANALGWTYRDAARTTALQDALRYAVREDRRPQVLHDYQTADLGAIGDTGWTRWGLERRGGGSKEGTQILDKFYLADGCFRVALSLGPDAPASMDEVGQALRRPARPLFLGRKGCPPATPLLEPFRVEADSPRDALRRLPAPEHAASDAVLRCWYDAAPDEAPGTVTEVWDRRDFVTNRFVGARRVVEGAHRGVLPASGGRVSAPLVVSRATLRVGPGGGERERRSTTPYLIHQAVADLFGDREDRGYLYRLLGEWPGGANVLVLSARAPLPAAAVTSPPHRRAFHVESKAFAPALSPGDVLDFEIRLNATQVVTTAATGRKVRTDAWEAVWQADHDTSCTPHEVYGGYLRRKLLDAAEVLEARVTERGEVQARRGDRPSAIRFVAVNVIGTLRVVDPERLVDQVSAGIGRAKAFGCGLLCLSRPGTVLRRRDAGGLEP